MGEAADDVMDGFICQYCGDFIDGEAPGYPRSCSGCGPTSKVAKGIDYEKIERTLRDNKYVVVQKTEVNYGMQFRIAGGSIVTVYHTGRFSVQGVENKKLKSLMFRIYNSIEDYK